MRGNQNQPTSLLPMTSENFIPTGKSARALICQKCCAGSKKISICWEAGYGARRCCNCGHIVPVTARVAKAGAPLQVAAIARLKALFEGRGPLAKWEVNPASANGCIWVSVQTEGNCYIASGGYFYVTARGKVDCKVVYDLTTKQAETMAHYNRMINV